MGKKSRERMTGKTLEQRMAKPKGNKPSNFRKKLKAKNEMIRLRKAMEKARIG